MTTSPWTTRDVPPELVHPYDDEGWWTDDTLGAKVAEWLAAAPDTAVHAEGVEAGSVVAFQVPNWREAIVSTSRSAVTAAATGRPAEGVRRVPWDATAHHQPVAKAAAAPSDPVVLAYTSGTTSEPKGVIHDHRTLLSELRHMNSWIAPGSSPNLLGSPVTHATGLLGAVLGPLCTAGEIHLIDRWDQGHALDVMAGDGIGGGTGASVTVADIAVHLEAMGIARQRWPEEVRVVTEFPRTASGKARKVDLRAELRGEVGR